MEYITANEICWDHDPEYNYGQAWSAFWHIGGYGPHF